MAVRKRCLALQVCGGLLLASYVISTQPLAADECREPATGTAKIPLISPPLSKVVVGSGRLQFHSAPNSGCPLNGVFVIPNDTLVAYAETSTGWTQVTYFLSKNGGDASGWVRSARLRTVGTIAPR